MRRLLVIDVGGTSVKLLTYPGPAKDGVPLREPRNLGSGRVGFDFARAAGDR